MKRCRFLQLVCSAVLVLLCLESGRSQVMGPLDNRRKLVFHADSLPLKLRDVPVPGSVYFYITDDRLSEAGHWFDFRDNTIFQRKPFPDSLRAKVFVVHYRVFSGRLVAPYRLLDTSVILPRWDPALAQNEIQFQSAPSVSDRGMMNYRGAFTRGITLGNNQNLALNSAFNLQLSGELGDDIRITGALSDNSIPIQPEGNSQQLQEFDKIFIVLSNKNNSLTVGDFEINKPPGYFLNYFKKLQGVQASNTTMIGQNKLTTSGGIAITKGKFNRYTLAVTEGNQGPYRLPGAEGETFVIILAGTERVYMDGIILSRGYDRDYIIDYNSGELTFMPSRIITKDSRVVVEYEYSNQQYLRSFYNLNVNYEMKKWTFNLNAYNEQDGKNSARGRELTAEDKLALAEAGDSITNTLVNSIREIDPANTSVVVSYSLKDTVINGKAFSFLHFPWREGGPRYIAEFTDVGAGNGYYIRAADGVNGRVYTFVGEDAGGRPLGQYNPLTRLTAPNQRQMFTLGSSWKVDSNTVVTAEAALSGYDNNRFSSKDDADNYGLGLNLSAVKKNMFFSRKKKWLADLGGSYERIDVNFNPINPYRSQEFNRDWNIANTQKESQQYMRVYLNQRIGPGFSFNYALSGLFQPLHFQGIKQESSVSFTLKKTSVNTSVSYLKTKSPAEISNFVRPNFTFSQSFPKLAGMTLLASYQGEFNHRNSAPADTLLSTSFAFHIFRLTARNDFSKMFSTEFYVQRRNDHLPFTTDLLLANHAFEYGAKSSLRQGQNSVLNLSATIRTFEIDRYKTNVNLTAKNTYLGQLDYLFATFKNRLSGNTLFEVSSGQEQKTEFNYIAVQPGTGQYVWNDYNNDSIQQVNEFTTEGFPEMRNYTRVNILTNQFIPTLNTSFNQSLRWQGRSASGDKKPSFFNRFSSQSSFRFDRKIKENARVGFWNPFYADIPDSSLVTYLQNFRHTFFFNRGDARYELQLTANTNNSRNILTTGYERRRTDAFSFISRYNIGLPFTLYLYITRQYKFSDSEAEAFKINNFSIRSNELKPEFNWLIGEFYRVSANYRFLQQQNRLAPSFEKAFSNDLSLNLDFNKSAKSSLRFSTTFSLIRFTGVRNSAVEFAMLEGLKNGQNYLWSISYDHNLKNNVQLNFGYDGRKSEGVSTVHTGRASVKAYF